MTMAPLSWLQICVFVMTCVFLWKLGACTTDTMESLEFSGSSIDTDYDDYTASMSLSIDSMIVPSITDTYSTASTEHRSDVINIYSSQNSFIYTTSTASSSSLSDESSTVQSFLSSLSVTSFPPIESSNYFQDFSSSTFTVSRLVISTETITEQQLTSFGVHTDQGGIIYTDTLLFPSSTYLMEFSSAEQEQSSSSVPIISSSIDTVIIPTPSLSSSFNEFTSDIFTSDLSTSDLSTSDLFTSDLSTSDLFTSDLSASELSTSDLSMSELSTTIVEESYSTLLDIVSSTTVIVDINQTSSTTVITSQLSTFSLFSPSPSPTPQMPSLVSESTSIYTQEESLSSSFFTPFVITATSTGDVESLITSSTVVSSLSVVSSVVYTTSYSVGISSSSAVLLSSSEFTENIPLSTFISTTSLFTSSLFDNTFTTSINPSMTQFTMSTVLSSTDIVLIPTFTTTTISQSFSLPINPSLTQFTSFTDITLIPTTTTSTVSESPLLPSPPVITTPVVMVTSVNASSLLIVWSPVPDTSSYLLTITQEGVRLKRNTVSIQIEANTTSYTLTGLLPYTSYTIQVASYDLNNVLREPSETFSIRTNEAIPGPPVNVTWIDVGNNLLNISWLPPVYPNGIITGYIVTIRHSTTSSYHYNVSGILSLVIRRPVTSGGGVFYIVVFAVNSMGTSEPQNATMISIVDTTTDTPSTLSGGAIAGIIIVILIIIILVIVVSAILIFFIWRRWHNSDGIDVKVGEMEYKTDLEQSTNTYITCMDEEDGGGSASQLTAKRWMRANANYSTPSALLPSIADLVRSYSTADDVVKNKTINRPNGLSTITETQKNVSESNNSSSERSRDAPSTLSSVCSKHNVDVKRVTVVTTNTDTTECRGGGLSEREAGMRESEIADGNHPLFEMMENIYVPATFDVDTLQQYHLDSSLIDIKEQVGVGEHSKISAAIAELLPFEKNEDVVAVKMLKDENDEEDFFTAAHILSQFSHDNILNLLAITLSPPMVVIPFMELADLKRYLVKVRRRTRLEHQPCNFDVRDQLSISLQIASGMEYLSSKFYIHRALQSKYILLDEDFRVKISGFQMSLSLGRPQKYQELKDNDKLPCKWFSLETLLDGRFTPYTDIWSFGVVMWEIFAYGLTPFRGVQNNEVIDHLRNGERLNKPSDCSEDVYTLMLHCWNERCRERPSFSELRQHLTGLLDNTKRIMEEEHLNNEQLNIDQFNIFDFQGIVTDTTTSALPLHQKSSTPPHDNEGMVLNKEESQLGPIESDVEMVVLRNDLSVRNEEQNRDSNQSSIPELVLSSQPLQNDEESQVDLSTAQLLSTEEYTVL